MANSSPVRGPRAFSATAILSSPSMPRLSEYMYESRNSPEIHKFKQQEAETSHARVREAASRALELYELKIETERIEREAAIEKEVGIQRREQERKRHELALVEQQRLEDIARAQKQHEEDQARLANLKAQSTPKPTPPPAQATPTPAAASTPAPTQQPPTINGATPTPTPAAPALTAAPAVTTPAQPATAAQPVASTTPAGPAQAAISAQPTSDRYIEIHQKLKELRKFIEAQCEENRDLKSRSGDLRRAIVMSIGQITIGGLKENKMPLNRIRENLRISLQNDSPPIDVSLFVLRPREPVAGAAHNEPQLPSLFVWLLNKLSKAVISQFVNEASADTSKAEGVGQVVASIFSEPEFFWRGQSMIDIIQAKYRVVCPVLFGSRGDDETPAGKMLNGWRRYKDTGNFISDVAHFSRMTGLGAGFAAMTLRDFSRAAAKKNPWPPSAYWAAMAGILNSPDDQLSDTQCVLLKAMIAHQEPSFIKLYGTAAVAALRTALVVFPARFANKSLYVEALRVHAVLLAQKTGLDLTAV